MLLPKDEIIADFEAQIRKMGGEYSEWFVGVAKDLREPLFETHLLEDKNDGFLYREAFTPGCAREIRGHFVTQRAATIDASSRQGGRLIYAYRKTPLDSCARIKNGTFAAAH
jgi:hypothetical protein